VVYEALEYWPEADPSQPDFAKEFWRQLESRIVPYADHCGTVTPQLAALMQEDFGVDFFAVPNCIPCSGKASSSRDETIEGAATESGSVRFLFQGNFAPHRGIELLLKAWGKVEPSAILLLRGPDNPFKDEMIKLAQSLGLTDERVRFLEPVAVALLEHAAGIDGDVGVIPYTPAGTNYANCSPNKLGQYLSVGLPIFANQTNFIAEVVGRAQCGLVVDFSREANIIDAVKRLCDQEYRRVCSMNSISFFKSEFNWDAVSKPFYAAMQGATASRSPERLTFYPRRVLTPKEILTSEDRHDPHESVVETHAEHPRGLIYNGLRRAWRAFPEPSRKILRPVAEKGHRWIFRAFRRK
jgi:glycosyltransferase involved in cell wall biosynthesis